MTKRAHLVCALRCRRASPPATYTCWLSGLGTYTASVLGKLTFAADGSYRDTKGRPGYYRTDGDRLTIVDGSFAGWVGALGNTSVRFRPDTPARPGAVDQDRRPRVQATTLTGGHHAPRRFHDPTRPVRQARCAPRRVRGVRPPWPVPRRPVRHSACARREADGLAVPADGGLPAEGKLV